MANGLKGEVPFKACNADWTLVLDFNALCAMETELGITADMMGERLSGSAATIRSVFRIGLAAKHGDMTDLEAGRLIGDIGIKDAAELLAKALKLAFPDAAKSAGGNAPLARAPRGK